MAERAGDIPAEGTASRRGVEAHARGRQAGSSRRRLPGAGRACLPRCSIPSKTIALPALTITELYRCRWQVELFFKWIKQHLRIKAFFGTSENAVKTQVWIAVSVYVLVAIVKKRLGLDASLYETLQILSLTMFEITPLHQLLTLAPPSMISSNSPNQLNLFES